MKNSNKYLLFSSVIALFVALSSVSTANELAWSADTFTTDDSTKVYSMVDQMPQIIGGIGEVYKHIKYPEKALDNRTEGRVFVQFVVDESGKVVNPSILKDIGDGCGEAAIEALKKVGFTPGMLNGEPVSVSYTLPVTFKMRN